MTPSSLYALFGYLGRYTSQTPISQPSSEALESTATPSALVSTQRACPSDGPTSCHNSTPVAGDGCCFVNPGGKMLLTQFWDQQVHAGGAEEDWTLHGLWPDLCDGTYDQYCHMTPEFDNITDVLQHHGQERLLEYMNRYWGPNSRLWSHEFNKHGTCINTLAPSCYGHLHEPGIEVVDYFTRATSMFRKLDTYRALREAGIVPHLQRHYPLNDVRDALERFTGSKAVLRCGGVRHDVLHEAWYVYFVKGSLQSGEFVPAKELGREGDAGNCSPWIKYLPKRPKGHDL